MVKNFFSCCFSWYFIKICFKWVFWDRHETCLKPRNSHLQVVNKIDIFKNSHRGWSLFYNQAVGQVYNLISLLLYWKSSLYKFVKFLFKNKKTLNLVQKIPLLVNLRQNVNRLLPYLKSAHSSLANIPKFYGNPENFEFWGQNCAVIIFETIVILC